MKSARSPGARTPSLNGEEPDVMVSLLDSAKEPELEIDEQTAADQQRTKNLIISFLLMVLVGLGNKIFQVLQFIPMYNYPLFVNLLTTFVYIPLSFSYIFPMLKCGTLITKEATEVPKYKFAVMGFLDSLAGIMQSLAVNYIANGSLVILLTQAAIPASMIISKIFLSTKYKVSQFMGASVVVIGIVIALLPSLMDPSNSGNGSHRIAWAIVLILSCVPMCLSSVYKEKALGDADIDAVYMNGWIALFQFLFAIPLLFPSAIASNVAIKDLPTNLLDGAKCLGMIDSVKNATMAGNGTMELLGASAGSNLHIDNCHDSPVYVSIYLIFNLAYNVLILLILKFGSSNILWLAMTVLVPLANFSFAFSFMPNHAALNWENIVGLFLILGGLMAYRFWSKLVTYCKNRNSPNVGDKEKPLLGSESPFMNTPMRGAGIHTANKKKVRRGSR